MATEQPKTCTVRRHVMVDAHVTVTPNIGYLLAWARTPEERMRMLKDWVKEFSAFLRDHRSQDANILDVEAEYKDLCSACGEEYEADAESFEDGKPHCTWCGALVVEPESVAQQKGGE